MSDSTGEYVVEEVEEEDDGKPVILRRLIFLSNPNVIQSEARMKNGNRPRIVSASDSTNLFIIFFFKLGKVDLNYLACQHHLVMVEELRQNLDLKNPGLKSILVLGLGGGALCTYLNQAYPQFIVDGVEIDPTMLDLARKYFGFKPSENLRPHIADGLSFVGDAAASGKRNLHKCTA